jgi:hypothetical protein
VRRVDTDGRATVAACVKGPDAEVEENTTNELIGYPCGLPFLHDTVTVWGNGPFTIVGVEAGPGTLVKTLYSLVTLFF